MSNIGSENVCFINGLPEDLQVNILMFLNFDGLRAVSKVSRGGNRLAKEAMNRKRGIEEVKGIKLVLKRAWEYAENLPSIKTGDAGLWAKWLEEIKKVVLSNGSIFQNDYAYNAFCGCALEYQVLYNENFRQCQFSENFKGCSVEAIRESFGRTRTITGLNLGIAYSLQWSAACISYCIDPNKRTVQMGIVIKWIYLQAMWKFVAYVTLMKRGRVDRVGADKISREVCKELLLILGTKSSDAGILETNLKSYGIEGVFEEAQKEERNREEVMKLMGYRVDNVEEEQGEEDVLVVVPVVVRGNNEGGWMRKMGEIYRMVFGGLMGSWEAMGDLLKWVMEEVQSRIEEGLVIEEIGEGMEEPVRYLGDSE